MDIREVIDGSMGFARAIMGPMGAMLPPAAPAGGPVMLTMVGSTEGTTWDQIRYQDQCEGLVRNDSAVPG